jgi:hypothetical protein
MLAFVATFGLELKCFCACGKNWVKNAVKKIANVEEKSRVLFALGSIMYSKDCPLHVEPVLWAEQQLEKLETHYFDSTHLCEYLNRHWLS